VLLGVLLGVAVLLGVLLGVGGNGISINIIFYYIEQAKAQLA
jgi:hypothetical protein